MAERKLEVRILGDSRDLERAFGRASSSAKRFDRNMSGIGRAAAGLAKGFAVAAAGVSALAVVGARELQEQAKVSAQTAVVLRNVGKASQLTAKQVEGLASALQASTGAADDEIQAASNVILRFGLITKSGKAAEQQLREMTSTALDLSVATGRDLSASAQALGRALASPEKAAGALRRAGIVLTDQQREQIKTMVESGRVADAQAVVLGLVQQRVKGSAQAFGNTLPGQIERAKRSFEDLAENTLAALAPALSKVVPVIVKAIQGIAPVIAQVGTIIAQLADELISNPAFRQFAATLRDLAVQGVQAVANGLRVLLPILVAILAPIAALASAVTGNATAMKLLTAAAAAFVGLKLAGYVTGLVSAFRALAVTQAAASGMRALTTATSALAFGMQGVSARAVGLAPGLTAAQAGVTRFGVAANATRGILPALGRSISGAFGGPVGMAIAAGSALAVVIGGDLVRSFMTAKDPARRYADAMRDAATGTQAAKDSLEGLAGALLGTADAQDRTRESTAARVSAERELRTLEKQGITSGPQYQAAVKAVEQARRGEAQATLAARDATDLMQQKQSEARTTVQGLVTSLGTARSNAMAGAQAIAGFGVNTDTARGQYQQFLTAANGKIMGSDELRKFQTEATSLAGVFRNSGTPAAREIATALDNVGKARTPEGVARWSAELVRLLGGSKREVDAARAAMNADMRNTGNVRPSSTFFSVLNQQVASAMSGLEALGRKVVEVAQQRLNRGRGQGSNERITTSEMSATPNLFSWFYQQRSAAAGAVQSLSGLAREGFIRNNPVAQEVARNRDARRKDLEDLTRRDFQARISAAETADEKKRIELDLAEFEDALRMETVEKNAESSAQQIDDLASQFERGAISATDFQTRLQGLIGGDTGAGFGLAFGEQWIGAFERALGDGSALQAIIANALGGRTGPQPVGGPSPEAEPETDPGGLYPKGRDLGPWRDKQERDRAFSRLSPELKRRAGKTRKGKEGDYRWGITIRPLAEGGILRRAVIAGEAGPEAVIPLTGTRGRDYMARVMQQVSGRGTTVVVNVAGNEFSAEEFARKIGPELRRQVALTGSF